MPFVGADAHLTRKRRWQGESDDDKLYRLYGNEQPGDAFFLNHPQDTARSRKILPLSKRAKIVSSIHDDSVDLFDDDDQADHPTRRRWASVQPLHNISDSSNRMARPVLTPCHVCHRKPTKKSHLDSFAECQGCGERTCFVCIRQCHGWDAMDGDSTLSEQETLSRSFHMDDVTDSEPNSAVDNQQLELPQQQHQQRRQEDRSQSHNIGVNAKGWHALGHRSVVCSRCCVERGGEGDVVCLGCLSSMEGA